MRCLDENTLRRLLRAYALIIFATTACGAVINYLTLDPYNLGDWLINYSGGFVRRGLAGEVAAVWWKLTAFNPGITVAVIQILCYGIYIFFTVRILEKTGNLRAYAFLAFSPFFLSFQINTFGGGYRKEILFLALLSVLVYLARNHQSLFPLSLRLSLLIYPFLILSHEMLALYLPYLLALDSLVSEKKMTMREKLVFLAPSALTFLFILAHPGGKEAVPFIERSLENMGAGIHGGAIAWIGRDLRYGLKFTLNVMKTRHYELYYFPLILTALAFRPVLPRLRALFPRMDAVVCITTSLLATVALSIVAIDWGRFIYINASALCLISTLVEAPDKQSGKSGPHPAWLLLYSLCWRLPHVHPLDTFILVPKGTKAAMPFFAPVQWVWIWVRFLKHF